MLCVAKNYALGGRKEWFWSSEMACCHRMKNKKSHRQTDVWSSACAFDVLYGFQEFEILLDNFLAVDDVDSLREG